MVGQAYRIREGYHRLEAVTKTEDTGSRQEPRTGEKRWTSVYPTQGPIITTTVSATLHFSYTTIFFKASTMQP